MYQLNRQVEADEEPPPLSHIIPSPSSRKTFTSSSPHIMSLPPSTQGSFAIESTKRPLDSSPPSHSSAICITITAAVLALLFFLLAGLAPARLSRAVSSTVTSELLLSSPSSPSYAGFISNADNPLLLSVYLYNLTNTADMYNHSTPLVLDEIGPFVFTDTRRKFNTAFNPAPPTTPTTFTYTEWQSLSFVPERSCERCALDAVFTSANLLTQAAYHAARTQQLMSNSSDLMEDFHIYCLAYNQTAGPLSLLFATRTAQELLFGYTDSTFLPLTFPGYFPNRTLDDTLATNLQSTIHTGTDDPHTAHHYTSYQNQTTLYTCSPATIYANPADCVYNTTVWATAAASTVRGSDGALFTDVNGGVISTSSAPVLFFYPFQRSIALEYSGVSNYWGMEALDFVFPDSLFRSSVVNGANSDYYQYLDGAINLTSTASFVPLVITLPHLVNVNTSSPLYPHNLTLLNTTTTTTTPPPTTNTFSIHPLTGLLTHLTTTQQVNLHLQPITYTAERDGQPVPVEWGSELRDGLLPLLWAVEEGGLSEAQVGVLRRADEVVSVLAWSPYGLLPAGAVCAVAAVYGVWWLWRVRQAEAAEFGSVKAVSAAGRGSTEAEAGWGEKSRLRSAGGGYSWYGAEQTEQDEDDDSDSPELTLRR